MKFKTSSIQKKKSSEMSQLMSCDSHAIHVQTCTCVCVCVCVVVTSLLSLALTPNRPPPTPSTIPRLSEICAPKLSQRKVIDHI